MPQKIDKTATEILKIIKEKGTPVSRSELKNHFHDQNIDGTLRHLLENAYIEETEYFSGYDINGKSYSFGRGKYVLGINGKLYFETRIKQAFLCYYPHITSTLYNLQTINALIKQ